MKKIFSVLISVFLCVLIAFDTAAFSAVYTFETQFEYDSADMAWLTDLVIKEDMTTVGGLAQHLTLKALPDAPYNTTPAAFADEVNKYCTLYSLNEGSEKAGFIWLFNLLGSGGGIYSYGVSDSDVKDYLTGNGIYYPDSVSDDELVMARALYLAMMTGSFDLSGNAEVELEQALVSYVTALSGIDGASLAEWLPSGNILSVEDYILAASRLALWSNGYDVTVNTDSSEVFRLVAVMTVEKIGISVNKDIPFDELKVVYTAALLGKKYGVTMTADKLSEALLSGSVPFYVLQLIGQQKAGLSIRPENSNYEEAFYSVAENTSVFNLEEDEFYADIFKYEAYLSEKRSSVWLYPTAYATGASDAVIKVTANGLEIKNNFFSEVPLDPALEKEDITVEVCCTSGGRTSECEYTVTVYQGKAPLSEKQPEAESASDEQPIATSDTIVSDILESLGLDKTVSSLVDDFYTALQPSLKNAISFIAPTFGTSDDNTIAGLSGERQEPSAEAPEADDYFYSILDKIGGAVDFDITGIAGAVLTDNYKADIFTFDYITF